MKKGIWNRMILCPIALSLALFNTGCQKTTDIAAESSSATVTEPSFAAASEPSSRQPEFQFSNEVILLREISVDLTADQMKDHISVSLIGLPGDADHRAEELVSKQGRHLQVTVTDGVTEETLYDRTFSVDPEKEGQLSLVTDQTSYYLMETDCREETGRNTYTGEVFSWKDGERIPAASLDTGFINDIYTASQAVLDHETPVGRQDALKDFQDKIALWSEGAELLAACDSFNEQHQLQSTFVSTGEHTYSPEDYYSLLLKRPLNSYTVERFDELMGYSGYCIYEDIYPFCTGSYFSEDGRLLASVGYTSPEETFLIDIDKDGITELISNVMWSDGGQATQIYRREDDTIMSGYADDMLDVEYDNINYSSEYSRYLPEENVVEIFYWISADESFHSKKYAIELDKIAFYPN